MELVEVDHDDVADAGPDHGLDGGAALARGAKLDELADLQQVVANAGAPRCLVYKRRSLELCQHARDVRATHLEQRRRG